ncbi:MAG: 23S rRNA (pseudouridine(1915)-N(3))-methyltransferase RlmH [Alloprevotella sp.]|nr:23S rRNA (pseudouridine(1915)-N(3))-methyltransferase RlmH [Alloprevotella sp.]
MKIAFLTVGKTTDARIAALVADYAARIAHYAPFEMLCVPDLKGARSLSAEEQKAREGEGIRKLLREGDHVVLLDERGQEPRSVEFAAWLEKKFRQAPRRLVFIVGGPYGFSQDVYARAAERLSLSRLTFSHQMVRLFFTEQLYRAFTILRGEPYHHE